MATATTTMTTTMEMAGKPKVIRRLRALEKCAAALHHLNQYLGTVVSCSYVIPQDLVDSSKRQLLQDTIEKAVALTTSEQPILQVGLLGEESAKPAYVEVGRVDLSRVITWHFPDSQPSFDKLLDNSIQSQLDTKFVELESHAPWRLSILHLENTQRLDVLFCFHHALADGVSGKIFHEQLLKQLNSPTPIDDSKLLLKNHILETPNTRQNFPPAQDRMVKYSVSMKYAASTLWRELKPKSFDSNNAKLARWAPILAAPYKTMYRRINVDNDTVQRVVAACRQHNTTLTGLFHSLTALSLTAQLKAEHASGYISQTTVNMRPHMPMPLPKHPDLVPTDTIGMIVNVLMHDFTQSTISEVRRLTAAAPAGDEGKAQLENIVWRMATTVRQEIQKSLDLGSKDQVIGLLPLITDWPKLISERINRPRATSWIVTNLGVMDGKSSAEGGGKWSINDAFFSLCAEGHGAAINVSPITVKGNDMVVNFSWQENVIESKIVERLIQDTVDWLAYIGKETTTTKTTTA